MRVIVWNSTTRELPRDEEGLRTSAVPRLSNRRDPSTTANRHSSVPVVIVRMALHATCPGQHGRVECHGDPSGAHRGPPGETDPNSRARLSF